MGLALEKEILRESDLTDGKGSIFNPFDLEELIALDTGRQQSDTLWLAEQMRQKTIDEQSARAAEILEKQDWKAILDNDITFVGLITGEKKNPVKYRNTNCIMSVAQYNRREQGNSLRYYLSKNPHSRYLTVAQGARIPAHDPNFRTKIQKFGRKISKFAMIAFHDWEVEVICRIFEMPRDSNRTYHLHANIVYRPLRIMSKQKWKAWLKFINKYFGHGSKDNGTIQNVDEIVKYMIKGDDIENIMNEDESELLWLAQQTFNIRIFSSMGGYKTFRSDLKAEKRKVIIRKGKPVIARKSSVFKCNGKKYEIYIDEDGNEIKVLKERPEDARDKLNEALTITNPYFFCSPFAEPVAVVRNMKQYKNGRLLDSYVDLEADLHPYRELAQRAWEANKAPSPELALQYAEMLEETQDIDKVVILSNHKKHIKEQAYECAVQREYKAAKNSVESCVVSFSVHTRTITVLEADQREAERQLISSMRRLKADEMLSYFFSDDRVIDEIGDFDTENIEHLPEHLEEQSRTPPKRRKYSSDDIQEDFYCQEMKRIMELKESELKGYIDTTKRVKSDQDFLGEIFGIE